jgi:hypothetical protein
VDALWTPQKKKKCAEGSYVTGSNTKHEHLTKQKGNGYFTKLIKMRDW